MPRSNPRLSKWILPRVLALVCCSLAGVVAVKAQAAPANEIPADDYVARAKQLLGKLYPDIDPNLVARIEDITPWGQAQAAGVTNHFLVSLSRFSDLKADAEGNPCWCEKTVVSALVFFDFQDKALWQFVVSGPLADSRQEAFGKLVQKHPEWSDAEVIRAFKDAGGRYGPNEKDALVRGLPLADLRPCIGQFEFKSAEWVLHRPEGGEQVLNDTGTICFWRIYGNSRLTSGANKTYLIVVEAIEGKIQQIGRH